MKNDLSARAEDYLRAIYDIVRDKGCARMKDISREVGVHPSSTTEMMRKLDQEGWVVYERYSGVTLTSQGERMAIVLANRHETFIKFFEALLVPKEIGQEDAHLCEHNLHSKTILQIHRFLKFIGKDCKGPLCPSVAPLKKWNKLFKKYCEWEEKR